jgi:hypothetical protein
MASESPQAAQGKSLFPQPVKRLSKAAPSGWGVNLTATFKLSADTTVTLG